MGGCALRPSSEDYAHAAFWAGWAAHREDVAELAERLGRPHGHVVDAAEACEAADAFEERGISVEGCDLQLRPGLAELLQRGPWLGARGLSAVFEFDDELPSSPCGQAAPSPTVLEPAAAGEASQRETKRRRVLGRLLRALDLRAATELWEEMPPHRRKALLAAGGRGTGQFWTAVPAVEGLAFGNVHW